MESINVYFGARRSVAVERLGMELWQKQRVRSTGANLDLQGPHLWPPRQRQRYCLGKIFF